MNKNAIQLGIEVNAAMLAAGQRIEGQPNEPPLAATVAGAALGALVCSIAQLQDRIEALERMLASTGGR